MANIKEKIENNIVVWMLGILLTGFLAGIATYEGALEIQNLETISKERIKKLEECTTVPIMTEQSMEIYSVPLPNYLAKSELELIFSKIKAAYNQESVEQLYQLMGPIGRSQLTKETASKQMQPTFEGLGKISNGFYVQHQYLGKQGLYRFFALNYSVQYEKAPKGFVTINVIDDGVSYQINGMMFNRLQ